MTVYEEKFNKLKSIQSGYIAKLNNSTMNQNMKRNTFPKPSWKLALLWHFSCLPIALVCTPSSMFSEMIFHYTELGCLKGLTVYQRTPHLSGISYYLQKSKDIKCNIGKKTTLIKRSSYWAACV